MFLVVHLHAKFYVPSSSRYEVTGAQSLNFDFACDLEKQVKVKIV